MPTSSPAFAFEASPEPLVLAAARTLAAIICAGDAVTRQALNRTLCGHFGGSDAEGRWSVRDAHAALELAQVLCLQQGGVDLATVSDDAEQAFAQLDALIPSQTVRSEEQIELQQFATPPRIAWLAARACSSRFTDLVALVEAVRGRGRPEQPVPRPQASPPFFAPGVVLNLPGRELIGAEAIVSHYRRSFAFLTEWLRVDTLIVDDRGLAAELYTRFTAHRDYPDFHALPLKKNDVYIVTTFVLYEFDTRGRFTRIRPALWQRDVSGVRSSD